MNRRVVILVGAAMAVLARKAAPVQKIENVTHHIRGTHQADIPTWTCPIRDPLPYGKKARRAQRGGRHV